MGFSLKRLFGSPGGGAPDGTTAARPSQGAGPGALPVRRAHEAVRRSSDRAGSPRSAPATDDWQRLPAGSSAGRPGVPRTRDDLERLVAAQGQGWEHLAWAGLLGAGLVARDGAVGRPSAAAPDRMVDDYPIFVRAVLDRLQEIAVAVEPALDSSAQLRAFGPPGEPGSYPLITELAQRQLDLLEDAGMLSEDVRRVLPPAHLVPAHELLRGVVDGVGEQLRGFLASAVRALDSLPERLRAGEKVNLTLSLVLDVDPAAVARIAREVGFARTSRR